MHQLLVARLKPGEQIDTGHLRFIRSCSAALSPETMSTMENAFGVPVLEAYGMTEASHQMASNPLPPAARKPGSVGLGTGVRIGIMNSGGQLLDTKEQGEIVIQGPSVIDGYENNPDANKTSFTNGWFRTGDQGFLDEHGYLTLVARIKELINRGGEKISPREIDEVLLTHPAVAEAVAFAVPHRMWGEEVAAAVVLREGATAKEAELMAHCRDRLADFKCPKKIHITHTIPRTATGKIQRRIVAAAYVESA
jgi:acyl-CoA synthetase (AMP-forming)/AMP-acid ligase II